MVQLGRYYEENELPTQIKGNDTSTFGGNVDVTGNVITDAPAFSAYLGSNQSISGSVFTKVNLSVEYFDTNSNYDNSTNYRFTPTIAGYYLINGTLFFGGTTVSRGIVSIFKNGSEYARTDNSISTQLASSISSLIYMNGTTDYIELYAYVVGTAPIVGGANNSYLSGFLARAV